MTQQHLVIVPLTLKDANEFVYKHHRHHKPVPGCKFSIGVITEEGDLCGVAIVGRPVARNYDDGFTAEVCRTCTDGTPNANSALYAACWRAAKAMGYRKLITYTQGDETGTSLTAAGWKVLAVREPRGSWYYHSGAEYRRKRDPIGSGGVQRTLWEAA